MILIKQKLMKVHKLLTRLLAKYYKGWILFYSNKMNLTLLLNMDNSIDYQIRREGVYEEETIDCMSQLFHERSIKYFFDIGSNIGEMSLYVAKNYPNVEVYAFEPIDFNFYQQHMHKIINKLNYSLEQKAILNRNGQVNFYLPNTINDGVDLNKFNSGNPSIYFDKYKKKDTKITVEGIAFDSYLQSKKIALRGDVLIKIDVEGAEAKVIEGMKNMLRKSHPVFIIMEIDFDIDCKAKEKMIDFLYHYNFKSYDLKFVPIQKITNYKKDNFLFIKE